MDTTCHLNLKPPADMSIARPEFAELMSRMATTVCVVSATDGNDSYGRTATAVLSLSADPPSLLVSIKTDSVLAQVMHQSSGFSVAMLAYGQDLVADAFAGKVPPSQRYLMGVWDQWPSGRPRLLGASAALDCSLTGSIEVSDHTLFVGTIISTSIPAQSRPLIWAGRRYRSLQ